MIDDDDDDDDCDDDDDDTNAKYNALMKTAPTTNLEPSFYHFF